MTEAQRIDAAPVEPHRVRLMTAANIASVLGAPRLVVLREIIPTLVNEGVLRRVGRRWFGRVADLESWALGTWTAPRGRR